MARVNTTIAEISDLATIFARAFLRLSRPAPHRAVFPTQEPQKLLEVPAGESPHDVTENDHRGAQWPTP